MMKKQISILLLIGIFMMGLIGCTQKVAETTHNENEFITDAPEREATNIAEEEQNTELPTEKQPETEMNGEPETTQTEDTQTVTEPKKSQPTEEKKEQTTQTTASTPTKPVQKEEPQIPETKPVVETVPKATKDDCDAVAQKALEYLNSYRSVPATKLTGLTAYAQFRSRQLIANFAHDTDDERAAATALAYGEYVDPTLYGMNGEPYYTAGAREAIAKAGYVGTVDEVAEQLAQLIKNSPKHWAYVGDAAYQYIAVGVSYESGMWYCDVAMTMENTDNN